MAAERVPMRKLREIVRLRLKEGMSGRAIARSCGLSPATASEYMGRIAVAKLTWPLAPELDDDEALTRLLFAQEGRPVGNRPEPDWAHVHRELRRKHVTKQLLWQEYREAHENGLQYSQFCELYLRWSGHISVTMRQTHRAGEKLFIDFSGDGHDVVDPNTGVTKAARYEPELNPTYAELARHYEVAVVSGRVPGGRGTRRRWSKGCCSPRGGFWRCCATGPSSRSTSCARR